MAAYKHRVLEFKSVLDAEEIDLKLLRKLAFSVGCPHEESVRSKCWKILLNYLPLKRQDWKKHLQEQRATYRQFIDEMIVQPGAKHDFSEREDVTFEDHPLNPNPDSEWSQFFKDNEMLIQIDKDCRRLCPDLAFFQSATPHPCVDVIKNERRLNSLRKRVEQSTLRSQIISKNRLGITTADFKRPKKSAYDDFVVLPEGEEAHWEVAERILFVYAKLNPGQGYVQGMNEILGPIYYTMASDADDDTQENAEADSFWCFTNLMSEIRDNFIKHLDESECGIGSLMRRFMSTVQDKDMALYLKLIEQDVKPQFFAFRWLTLMLSQEFQLPDVQRLWDTLFADGDRFKFLLYVCCSMLILVREDLLTNDFSANMKLLQNYPITDITRILSKAVEVSGRL